MDVAPLSWKNEPASDVSPYSCHEHDPGLPESCGRRVWGLVLARPAFEVTGYGDPRTKSVGYSVRNLYGTVGLDRYKDFVLSWPEGGVEYPRVFMDPQQAEKYRKAVRADPDFPLRKMLEDYYWFTEDPETARRVVPQVLKHLDRNIRYIITSLSIHHHHTLSAYGEPIGLTEAVLSWPGLPEEKREEIRARLALLCYLLVEPDVTSAGDGSHHGNPNMGVSRLMDRSNLMAMLPDHPMHEKWRDYMSKFMAYKAGSFMAPEGAWFEYGASYHMHGYGKLERGLMGVLNSDAAAADRLWAYNRADFDYFLNLLSAFDSRYGSRTIPGMANAPTAQSPHYLQATGTVAERDPEFAANLRWGWNANGRMIGTGADALTIPAMVRPWIEPQKADLGSRSYPGFGVVFRAHQGPKETNLFLRSGYHWSHWNQDQGNLILYSRGAVLLPPQPYQYGGPSNRAFPDKNFMRFGAPTNDLPHDWADSNILDSSFGPTVDYAWSSTGYPGWFISPGGRKGWSRGRKLVGGLGQKEGPFTWDRQIAFLKGENAASPNYFVIHDSVNGSPSVNPRKQGELAGWFNLSVLGREEDVDVRENRVAVESEWSTDLDVLFTDRDPTDFEVREDELRLAVGPYSQPTGSSPNWVEEKERRVMLRLKNPPGQGVSWVLYPRGEGEPIPTATRIAPGVTRVVTSEGTDYVFLSTTPVRYEGEGVEFSGLAGAVRLRKDGRLTLALSAGPGRIGYQGRVIESDAPFERTLPPDGEAPEDIAVPDYAIQSPATAEKERAVTEHLTTSTVEGATQYVLDAPAATTVADGRVRLHGRRATVIVEGDRIRFVVPEPAYARLTVGNVGVRGVGPFDLTFTPESITGRVDGEVRTLVTTWPEEITRPGYWMDGVRYYAGFADEHSIYKNTESPQFAIAMGVSGGPHEVKISEWTWPQMPPEPERATIAVE
jgi:hypothetical protein